MKRLLLSLLVALPVLLTTTAVAQKKKEKDPAEEIQKKISGIMTYRVAIKDTANLANIANTYSSIAEYNKATVNNFLSNQTYQKLGESLTKLTPLDKIIVNKNFEIITENDFPNYWKGPIQKVEIVSIEGEVTGTQDVQNTISPSDITSIIFYEEWKIDPLTLEMTKKVLGYSLLALTENIAFGNSTEKTLFTIVKDEASLQKLKDNFPHL